MATYYYGSGNTEGSYTNTANDLDIQLAACGDDITITTGGSLTKIGIKVSNAYASPLPVKVAIYYNNGGTWTRARSKTTTIPIQSIAWVDFPLDGSGEAAPYTVANGQVIRVMFTTEYSCPSAAYAGTSNGMWIDSNYATNFESTPTFGTDDWQWAVRVSVDAAGKVTKNTRSFPLGIEAGMNRRM